jgi:hypothetical protein
VILLLDLKLKHRFEARSSGDDMARARNTIAISRSELARACLEEIRQWPGCEGVVSVGVLAAPPDLFLLRVIEYGETQTNRADRALRTIERSKLREFHLKAD